MKSFLVRCASLVVLIGLPIIHHYFQSQSVTMLIYILTIALCCYFLIPLTKNPLFNYFILLGLLPLAAYYLNDINALIPLYAFFVLESSFHLKRRAFPLFIFSLGLICLIITIVGFVEWYYFLLFVILLICAYFLHNYLSENNEKSILYEGLLSEYRQLRRISTEQEQFARLEERTKIARDMHDSVGHKLTALLMQLEIISNEQNNSAIQEVKNLARESLEETRYAVRQLKSRDTSGIQSVIQLIRKLEMESRLQIRFTLEKGVLSLPISNQHSIVLYRVLQECLTNAMKHSQSKEIEVIIGMDSLGQLMFKVVNKCQSDSILVKGFGLTNMEERLKEIGGQLRIQRTNDQFIVEGMLPIKG